MRRIYEAWATGDFRAVDDLDQHVVLVIRPDFPEFGVFLGAEGVRDYTRRFLEQWGRLTIEAKHLRGVGDTVLAHVVQHGKGRASGIEGTNSYFQLFTFRGGKIVRMESIMDEGEARQAVGLSAQPQSEEPAEVVRRAFEVFNRDGPEAALVWLAPDVEWHDLPDQPDAGVYHGHTGFLAANEQFFGELEDYRVNLDEAFDRGEQVVVCIRVTGRGRSSGAKFEQRAVGVWTVRNGFVVRAVWFRTREEALETVGLRE